MNSAREYTLLTTQSILKLVQACCRNKVSSLAQIRCFLLAGQYRTPFNGLQPYSPRRVIPFAFSTSQQGNPSSPVRGESRVATLTLVFLSTIGTAMCPITCTTRRQAARHTYRILPHSIPVSFSQLSYLGLSCLGLLHHGISSCSIILYSYCRTR